jgi:nucleoside phosphorylase
VHPWRASRLKVTNAGLVAWRAAERISDADGELDGMSGVRIGVIIALDEEFEAYEDVVGPVLPKSDPETGRRYYVSEVGEANMIAGVVGRKGYDHAAIVANDLIRFYRPQILVTLGISGGLHDDVGLGDVILGEQIVNYLANSKAIPSDRPTTGSDGFSLRLAGETYRSDEWLIRSALEQQRERTFGYRNWHEAVTAEAASVGYEANVKLHAGKLAAGPVVGAAEGFRAWLRAHQRDLLALDMESSGVAASALADAVRRVRFVAIRGVSDSADANKGQLEADTQGSVRALAMHAATRFLLAWAPALVHALPDEDRC